MLDSADMGVINVDQLKGAAQWFEPEHRHYWEERLPISNVDCRA